MPFSTEAGERLIFSEHQIKLEKAKSGCAELVHHGFIPLWSLPVAQKHLPLNWAIKGQKWSFAGDSRGKHSGLLGWQAVVGGVSHPSSAMLPAAAPSAPPPESRVGSSVALRAGRRFAGAVTALLPALVAQEGFFSSPCYPCVAGRALRWTWFGGSLKAPSWCACEGACPSDLARWGAPAWTLPF